MPTFFSTASSPGSLGGRGDLVRLVCVIVVGLAAVVGCAGEARQLRQLRSPVSQERFQAVRWLGEHGSRASLAALVDALEDRDGGVRWAAIEALRDRTGETLDYHAGDPEARRRQAVARWRQWLQEEGITSEADQQPSKPKGQLQQS